MDRYDKPAFEQITNSASTVATAPLSVPPPSGGTITFVGNRPNACVAIGDSTEFTKDLKSGDWLFFESSLRLARVEKVINDTKVILADRFTGGFIDDSPQDFYVIPKNKADLRYLQLEKPEEVDMEINVIDRNGNTKELVDFYDAGIFGNTIGLARKKQSPVIVEFTESDPEVEIEAKYTYIQQP